MTFGKKLSMLRKTRGLTQSQLAAQLNVTDKAVSKWELGNGLPEIYTIRDIANLFDVTMEQLINDKDDSLLCSSERKTGDNHTSVGESIDARTHAEFLNSLLGKNYKGYMKCGYPLGATSIIWMIRLNGLESYAGWRNTISSDGLEIVEQYTGNEDMRIESHKNGTLNHLRYVFDIFDCGYGRRKYVFRGGFKCVSDNQSRRVWQKFCDEADFTELDKVERI